jgi:hypothetical protein
MNPGGRRPEAYSSACARRSPARSFAISVCAWSAAFASTSRSLPLKLLELFQLPASSL